MGGSQSSCVSPRTTEDPRLPRRISKRNPSTAFCLPETTERRCSPAERVNINIATEEELMTLPGVNRFIARNIVQYRNDIGHYKQVEDVALVSGVGATKLTLFKDEITVGWRETRDSSASEVRLPRSVSVNSANVFQLMRVPGLNQRLAENIVARRDKRGPYNCLDQLTKVRGISAAVLGAARPRLSLTDVPIVPSSTSCSKASSKKVSRNATPCSSSIRSQRDSCSDEDSGVIEEEFPSDNSLTVMYRYIQPLWKSYKRPTSPSFSGVRGSRTARRVAFWRVELNSEAVLNPGVRTVVCRTLLENGISLLIIKGTSELQALEKLCDQLNHPNSVELRDWKHHTGTWSCHVLESDQSQRLSCMYDESCGVRLDDVMPAVTSSTTDHSHQQREFTFKIDDIEVAIALTNDVVDHQSEKLRLRIDASADSEADKSNPEVMTVSDESFCTGERGVITDWLSHPLIPSQWSWGGSVSAHRPHWIELYTSRPKFSYS